MPILRINSRVDGLELHDAPKADVLSALRVAARGFGPVIVMVHGYKYLPGKPRRCPHGSLFAAAADGAHAAWPHHLGFGRGAPGEGLALCFGWEARGKLTAAARRATKAGRHLADCLREIHTAAPRRPVHILSHSLGSEVALEALHHLPPGAVQRIVALTAASYRSRAGAAMATPAGRQAELLNVTSRENDLFDFLFEWAVDAPERGDRALGHGLDGHNIATLQLDHPAHLAALAALGHTLAPAQRRICHWSGYLRPGTLRLWADVMRRPRALPLARLAPTPPAPRWSRLIAWPPAAATRPRSPEAAV
jgi:hypothetical protein